MQKIYLTRSYRSGENLAQCASGQGSYWTQEQGSADQIL